ncbi:MAG: hypothetical protein K2Z25_21165 [Beijerinckiaceae bacterium]|nr:hypothetical protein [Beijerinckiaceae bacterium]
MTSSNRVQLAVVREVTPGTTPSTPRMRKARITGESLSFAPEYVDPDEIRDDRMLNDPIKVMQASTGGVNFELSYPDDGSPMSEFYRSGFFAPWVNTPTFDNDGTADSVVTGVTDSSDTFAVASGGASVVAGHLVRATGFTNAANNQVFRAASSTGTTIVGASLTLTDEAAPPAAAKLKVVGFQGASGDITATSTGLGSTTLDFTTLGIAVGQWIKIGGTATGDKFATAALNDWARITAIAATALTLDHLPAAWTTDAGTGKTLKVWFGDYIRNGTTVTSLTLERGFLGQAVPTYIVNTGMQVGELQHSITSRQKITGSVTFTGMGGSQSTTALDASPDAVTTGLVMAANANVGRLYENGSRLTSPNWAMEVAFTINNNLRTNESVDEASPVAVREGECTVTGSVNSYFGDNSLLAKFYAGTPSSLATRVDKNGQALVFAFPRVTYRSDGNPNASGKNTDVMLPLGWQASKDTLIGAHATLDRLPYFE